jgi:predicted DNA-binding transcriptional regulator AlpA
MINSDPQTFLPAGRVRSRYGVSDMALWRWLRNERLAFPRPLRINGRRFWKLADLEAWEASRAADASASAPTCGRFTGSL